ncbi:MAG: hypothetical protein H8F28_17380 [Fibrella sp.]|nr:hypothetical protein [Armatimonadota bacterium]
MRTKGMTLKTAVSVVALLAVCGFSLGCTSRGDTSGFKPEQKPSKAQLGKQIEEIKANPKIPEGIKTTAIKKLEADMASAK